LRFGIEPVVNTLSNWPFSEVETPNESSGRLAKLLAYMAVIIPIAARTMFSSCLASIEMSENESTLSTVSFEVI
jgi:hypothetical protein